MKTLYAGQFCAAMHLHKLQFVSLVPIATSAWVLFDENYFIWEREAVEREAAEGRRLAILIIYFSFYFFKKDCCRFARKNFNSKYLSFLHNFELIFLL